MPVTFQSPSVHVVTRFATFSGGEIHTAELARKLSKVTATTLWADTNSRVARHFSARQIVPFSGDFPRGGTLVVVGTYTEIEPWIARARPERIVVIINLSFAAQVFAFLTRLKSYPLPEPELVFVSDRLRRTLGLAGRICPSMTDLDRFRPRPDFTASAQQPFTIGRLSRDTAEKHHPQDASLYRMLALSGVRVQLMGATCIAPMVGPGYPEITLLPAGSAPAEAFLSTLDVFFYRTSPTWNEASGGVVLEALACGLPVVAHVNGGYTDWIRHGENGFLFNTQEEGLEYLLVLQKDAQRLERMRTQARKSAEAIERAPCDNYIDWISGRLSESGSMHHV